MFSPILTNAESYQMNFSAIGNINWAHLKSHCFNDGVCTLHRLSEALLPLECLKCACPPEWNGTRCETRIAFPKQPLVVYVSSGNGGLIVVVVMLLLLVVALKFPHTSFLLLISLQENLYPGLNKLIVLKEQQELGHRVAAKHRKYHNLAVGFVESTDWISDLEIQHYFP
ncbi:hypothetical protein CSKR_108419 [Clonorchis sinensis]|uniref:Uncharacterized protein n=1 Tax=Clonorchis sinensis TaxID=79923 RepID=A0A3R7FRZ0_CLOSI|nr:hypothetical protein CSKR_108419 [Clonorchis sinensis]